MRVEDSRSGGDTACRLRADVRIDSGNATLLFSLYLREKVNRVFFPKKYSWLE